MSKLVISLATRGRPVQLIDTVTKSIANWTAPNTVMMVQIDADDLETINGLNQSAPHAWFVGPNGPRVIIDGRPREDTIAAKWNRAMQIPADLYLVAADDDPYITPGYDTKLLEAAKLFGDGIGMVYGHMANLSFSGVVAPTRKLVEALGFIQPDYFPYWFCDHWTDDIARLIGRISFADVRTDQSKPGKTQELREPGWWATWFDAAYLVRRKQALAIIDSEDFQESDATKARLRANAPLVDHRTRWINDQVRSQAAQLVTWSGLSIKDERYLRVRARAEAMVPQLTEGMPAEEAMKYRLALTPPAEIVNLQRAYA